MRRPASRTWLFAISLVWLLAVLTATTRPTYGKQLKHNRKAVHDVFGNAADKIAGGQQTFRFDTFGDQAFWGDTLGLHRAIEGAALGGVGPGVSPQTALAVGLKIDIDALPNNLRAQIRRGAVDLKSPAVTVALLKLDAVVGVKGVFSGDTLKSVGITCSFCHATVDNSAASLCFGAITPNPGTGCIGRRLDGWANRDLNVGAIVALAPNLQPFSSLLGTDDATVRTILNSWGPGKFDAELILDGKAFNPSQESNGVVTGKNVPGATLIPPAFGLGGVNLHTWTGWGSVPYWNAFVANLEMHGIGRFWDPRLNNAAQFPIAAAHGFADLPHIDPDDDQITSTLSNLQFYQLALPSPEPPAGSFNEAAAERGDELFSGKAGCNNCHVEPLWTDPGWNLHTPADICIDDFQANRAPDLRYRSSPIGALFTHLKGGFYHDGRFPTLASVVDHYNTCMNLNLSAGEKNDVVQYLLSLTFDDSN
ncbi:MAG TPA: hypothetical protein VL173_02110 [Vicinamibacterales bacterium]|jgi:hypothetical protein|nr:hypothetical protein [Vicinamibacterales bacterium]